MSESIIGKVRCIRYDNFGGAKVGEEFLLYQNSIGVFIETKDWPHGRHLCADLSSGGVPMYEYVVKNKFQPGQKVRRLTSNGKFKSGDIVTVDKYLGLTRFSVKEDPNGPEHHDECCAPVSESEISENASLGIRLNEGKLRWRNFPLFLFEPVIEVGSKAEKHPGNPDGKYETYNFLNGMHISDTLDSIKRHLMKFESPYNSDNDEESQVSHLAHIAWNALVALHNLKTRPELDDRWKGKK